MPDEWKKAQCPACHTPNVHKIAKDEHFPAEPAAMTSVGVQGCNLIFTFVREATRTTQR